MSASHRGAAWEAWGVRGRGGGQNCTMIEDRDSRGHRKTTWQVQPNPCLEAAHHGQIQSQFPEASKVSWQKTTQPPFCSSHGVVHSLWAVAPYGHQSHSPPRPQSPVGASPGWDNGVHLLESPEGSVKTQTTGPHLRAAHSEGPGRGLRICISS